MAVRCLSSDRHPIPVALADLRIAAHHSVPVLITCGDDRDREWCARLIHLHSAEACGPFVVVRFQMPAALPANALPPNVGAQHINGLRQTFDRARGGILFVDDLVALPADGQHELCRLLEGEVAKRHATAAQPARSVRVIAGASRDLDLERESGAFSEVLFYRLNVLHIVAERSH